MRTIQFGMAAVVAAGAFAVLPGCQNAGKRDDTSKPMAVSATYDRAYIATRDTDATATPGGTTMKLTKGTRAFFAEVPTTGDWQQARVEGQGVVYVRPTDFTKEVR
ncbi:MAG: hypothetical protein JWO31_3990 [Phycisphaerales bacterium]|nr:hypothetical protein [Phycisphaerales bacterium]